MVGSWPGDVDVEDEIARNLDERYTGAVNHVGRVQGHTTNEGDKVACSTAVTYTDSSPRAQDALYPPGRRAASKRCDETLWFEDGDLVLVARDVEFRVFKGPLVAQSPLFKDMLSIPQPRNDNADAASNTRARPDIAVVHVSDSPEDIKHFLPLFIGQPPSLEPSFAEVSACVRLSHKYQCDAILQRMLSYLKIYYVSDWDPWWRLSQYDPPRFTPIERIGVVNLARLTQTDSMLPLALMYCCMLGSELFDGFAREDGTLERLSPEDLARCYVGKARLLEASIDALHRVFRPVVAKSCTRPSRCREVLHRLVSEICADAELMEQVRKLRWDAYKTEYIKRIDVNRELCAKCADMLGRTGRQGELQKEMFMKLPEMMGLTVEGWAPSLCASAVSS